jgi:tetratricopeptide (TPR) repeat protein
MADQAAGLCAGYHSELDPFIFSDIERLYGRLGDASKEEEFYGRVIAARSLVFFDMVLPQAADRDMERGQFHDAEDLYRQGIRDFQNRGDGQQGAEMLDGLAEACEKEGKFQEAARARKKAKALRARP